MWLDVAAILIVLLYTIVGYFQGIIVQIFRIIGLVLVFFYIAFVAEPVGQWLGGQLHMNAVTAYCAALIVGALVLYAACTLIGKSIHKMLAATETPQMLDRILGMGLGLVKGLVVAFLFLCLLGLVPPEAMGNAPWLKNQASRSMLVKRVAPWNPMPELRFLADLEDYKKLLIDTRAQEILQQKDPAFRRLYDNEKFREAMNDATAEKGELKGLLSRKDWPRVLVHPKVLALVFDREVRKLLNEMRPGEALRQAAAERGEKPK
jgi:uncharacterized membrane protein required for colicin V production